MIVSRYLAAAFAVATTASMVAVATIYLVVDFVDRAKIYEGRGWFAAVVELYACKALIVGYQLMPAAVAFGAAVSLSALRRTGEVTALRALGHGPGALLTPLLVLASLLSGAMLWAEDPVVVPANYRAEEITVQRFQRFGDWAVYHQGKRWFRGDAKRIWYLTRPDGDGFAGVTLYELDDRFAVKKRLDAEHIDPSGPGEWRLTNVVERTFSTAGLVSETRAESVTRRFPDDLQLFRVKTGRPNQMRRNELPQQIDVREKLGLPVREFQLALHERRSYPFTAIPATLGAAALALRKRRDGHLTAAIGEGVLVVVLLYAMTALARTATLAGHLAPWMGGWLPLALAAALALVATRLAR